MICELSPETFADPGLFMPQVSVEALGLQQPPIGSTDAGVGGLDYSTLIASAERQFQKANQYRLKLAETALCFGETDGQGWRARKSLPATQPVYEYSSSRCPHPFKHHTTYAVSKKSRTLATIWLGVMWLAASSTNCFPRKWTSSLSRFRISSCAVPGPNSRM